MSTISPLTSNRAAGIGAQHPRHDLHERAFARSVLARHGVNLSRKDGEVHAAKRLHADESLGDLTHLQERLHAFLNSLPGS